jgi:hypothetical protein
MPDCCPHCGGETTPGSDYCPHWLMRVGSVQRPATPPVPAEPKPLPVARKRDMSKVVLGAVIVALIAALAFSFTMGTDSDTEVSELQNQLASITANYNSLQGQ